ncbi:hypothetical protein ABIF78_007676 [Bradyrhizobium japonicum]
MDKRTIEWIAEGMFNSLGPSITLLEAEAIKDSLAQKIASRAQMFFPAALREEDGNSSDSSA